MSDLVDPETFTQALFKNIRRRCFRTELKSLGLFLLGAGGGMVVVFLVFGVQGVLWLTAAIGIVAAAVLARFIYKLSSDAGYRRSFLRFLAMDDEHEGD